MEIPTIFNNSKLEHIEWHDAKIEKISIHPEGLLEIFFKHICSYHRISSNRTEVWSSRALLVLNGVTNLNIDNIISDQYIDGDLRDDEGNEVSLIPINVDKPIFSFKIYVAGYGTNIDILAKSAILKKLEPIEKLDVLED